MREDIPEYSRRQAMNAGYLLEQLGCKNYGILTILLAQMLEEDRAKLAKLQAGNHRPEVTAQVVASVESFATHIEGLLDAIMASQEAANTARKTIRNTNPDGSPRHA